MKTKTPTQTDFRQKHKPARPPYLGVMLREEDCHALANGVVTATVQVMAFEALQTFWPQLEVKP